MTGFVEGLSAASSWLFGTEAAASAGGAAATAGTVGSTAAAGAGAGAGTTGALTAGNVATAASAASAAASLAQATKKMPKQARPTPMPDQNSPEAEAARRRMLASAAARSGRASTFLSQDSKLGG